jgi:hypothetical protein
VAVYFIKYELKIVTTFPVIQGDSKKQDMTPHSSPLVYLPRVCLLHGAMEERLERKLTAGLPGRQDNTAEIG